MEQQSLAVASMRLESGAAEVGNMVSGFAEVFFPNHDFPGPGECPGRETQNQEQATGSPETFPTESINGLYL